MSQDSVAGSRAPRAAPVLALSGQHWGLPGVSEPGKAAVRLQEQLLALFGAFKSSISECNFLYGFIRNSFRVCCTTNSSIYP